MAGHAEKYKVNNFPKDLTPTCSPIKIQIEEYP